LRKANLFIVGAMKAGTTSFSNLIAQHPAIYFSPIKEPNFFVDKLPENIYTPPKFFSLEKYFEKEFPNPLHIAHVKYIFQYDKLFSATECDYKYFADGSTSYLHAPETAEKIYNYNPDSKIIIIIRNGLSRALSHYKMDLGHGRTIEPFEKVLKQNWNEYKNGALNNWSYIGMSLYAENICHYKKLFKENVLILSFEDLLYNEKEVLKKVFSFLEIEYLPLQLSHENPSFNIRFAGLLKWLYKTGMKDLFSYILPIKIRHAAFGLLKRKSNSNIELSQDFKNDLLCLFREDLIKLEKGC
jgi:hypothetical protein